MAASMTVDEVIAKAYLHAQRKDTAPTTGSKKYNVLLQLADSFQKEWASEPDVEWNSLFSLENIGSVTATDTFALPAGTDYISKDPENPIYTYDSGTDQRNDYTYVEPGKLYKYEYDNGVSQQGTNIVFAEAFTADSPDFGWDIFVPTIQDVADITDGAETVAVDDPMWLAFMMAAEFIRNDLVRQNQYNNLLAHAQLLMDKMKERNMSHIDEIAGGFEPMGVSWE